MKEICAVNESQKAGLRAEITARLAELEDLEEGTQAAARPVELDQQRTGRLSRMDAIQQQEMARAARARRQAEAARLRHALDRLETDEGYGYCEDCGEPIAPARLQLDPGARLCISCARG